MNKKTRSILFISSFLLCLSSCAKPKMHDIRFESEIHDFGVVDEETDVHYTFVFYNPGTTALTIENVQPACGCTTASGWDKNVSPGGKGRIPITFKTPRFNGEVTKIINVKTDVPERPSVQLTLKGIIRIPIEIVPLNAWLGEVRKDTGSLHGSFDIIDNMKTPLKLLEVTPPDNRTRYSIATIEKNRKYRLEYTLDAPFDGRETVEKQFTIRTNDKKNEYVYPKFYYFVPPPLRVFPAKIIVDTERLSRNSMMDIDIKSGMDDPIKILDPRLHGGRGITFSLKENVKDKYYQITVKIPTDFKFADEKIFLTFRVQNDPKKEVYTIPIEAKNRQ